MSNGADQLLYCNDAVKVASTYLPPEMEFDLPLFFASMHDWFVMRNFR